MRFSDFSKCRGLLIYLSCILWSICCERRWCIRQGIEGRACSLGLDNHRIHVCCMTHATNFNSELSVSICWTIEYNWSWLYIYKLLVSSLDLHLVIIILIWICFFLCRSLFWARCLCNLLGSPPFLLCNHMLLIRRIINSNDHTGGIILRIGSILVAWRSNVTFRCIDYLSLIQYYRDFLNFIYLITWIQCLTISLPRVKLAGVRFNLITICLMRFRWFWNYVLPSELGSGRLWRANLRRRHVL